MIHNIEIPNRQSQISIPFYHLKFGIWWYRFNGEGQIGSIGFILLGSKAFRLCILHKKQSLKALEQDSLKAVLPTTNH